MKEKRKIAPSAARVRWSVEATSLIAVQFATLQREGILLPIGYSYFLLQDAEYLYCIPEFVGNVAVNPTNLANGADYMELKELKLSKKKVVEKYVTLQRYNEYKQKSSGKYQVGPLFMPTKPTPLPYTYTRIIRMGFRLPQNPFIRTKRKIVLD